MKRTFREYHKFTDKEFKQLWNNCFFVFDTNTLLNMYKYSRKTVDTYFEVLKELKTRDQLWIPYQVGYEFYENRIDVISEYKKSYDEILKILNQAKGDIQTKYKDHPFLDLSNIKEEMNKGLKSVESNIETQKQKHPNWLEKDEVLEKLNELFEGNVGNNYEKQRLNEIKNKGEIRYEKKVPPGFKDKQKPEDKKYGDLILWYQIIDKATESKKPIVLISGDVKEDWWLKKDGKKLVPLPSLKKEMYDKAGVDFHIYTPDRFLGYYKIDNKKIDDKAIKEVKKIRELDEERKKRRIDKMQKEREMDSKIFGRSSVEYIHLLEVLEHLVINIQKLEIHPRHINEFKHLFHEIIKIRNRFAHEEIDSMSDYTLYEYTKKILFIVDGLSNLESDNQEVSVKLRECIVELEHMNHKFNPLFKF